MISTDEVIAYLPGSLFSVATKSESAVEAKLDDVPDVLQGDRV